MSSTSELSSFAARLRKRILMSEWAGDAEFEALALRLFAHQFASNGSYRRLCEARGARPDRVARWRDIPAVPASAFKELELSCLPVAERAAVFHSSGTTGQRPSRHYHSAASLALYEASLLRWFEANSQLPLANSQASVRLPLANSQASIRPPLANSQAVFLAPSPSQAPHSSLVHMFETIRREAGQGEETFVGEVAGDGAWTVEADAALDRLREASGAGEAVFIFGTAFSFVHLLDYLAEQDLWLELPPGSSALETGGYKGRSRSLPKTELHALVSERLGIPPARIICEYGMSELSSQAYDSAVVPAVRPLHAPCTTHHAPRSFRFPPWARVQIVSPETGCEVAEGRTGLIRVFDLANVYSVMAIQTEDLGTRCGGGFTLAGRAALAEPRGCSLMAV